MQPKTSEAPRGLEEAAQLAVAQWCPALVGYNPLSPEEVAARRGVLEVSAP